MTLKGRIVLLEQRGGCGLCSCPIQGVVVIESGEPDPPPPLREADGSCPVCGGRVPDPLPRVVIHMPANGRAAPGGEDGWA